MKRWAHTLRVLGRSGRLPGLAAKARWVWWRHVKRYEYEVCHACGTPVEQVWRCTDVTWDTHAWGGPGGVACLSCFKGWILRDGLHPITVPDGHIDGGVFVSPMRLPEVR